MNYLKAMQRSSDGLWDFTTTNDGQTRPTGRCAEARLDGREHGHATAQEAQACYHHFLLDHALHFSPCKFADPCVECGATPTGRAELGFGVPSPVGNFCVHHRTREAVAAHTEPAVEIWSS